MSIDLVLETISEVADNTKHPISDRIRLIENLLKFANNSQEPDLTPPLKEDKEDV